MTVKEMAARLRLTRHLVELAGLRRVEDTEARNLLHIGTSARNGKDSGEYSGIAFVGYDLHGQERGVYQIRRDFPEITNGKEKNK